MVRGTVLAPRGGRVARALGPKEHSADRNPPYERVRKKCPDTPPLLGPLTQSFETKTGTAMNDWHRTTKNIKFYPIK